MCAPLTIDFVFDQMTLLHCIAICALSIEGMRQCSSERWEYSLDNHMRSNLANQPCWVVNFLNLKPKYDRMAIQTFVITMLRSAADKFCLEKNESKLHFDRKLELEKSFRIFDFHTKGWLSLNEKYEGFLYVFGSHSHFSILPGFTANFHSIKSARKLVNQNNLFSVLRPFTTAL